MSGWSAAGAQALSFDVRAPRTARMGLLLETVAGGRFLFADARLLQAPPVECTASYAFDPGLLTDTAWRRLVVPFHDLARGSSAMTGGPMPSHPLKSLAIVCAGEAPTWVDIAAVTFLRPRTIVRRAGEERRFCLGGSVVGFAGDEIVYAVAGDRSGAPHRQTGLDQRGFFFFDLMSPGIYEVWAQRGGESLYDRRGHLVEVTADTMTLSLGPWPRWAPSSPRP
jgi:hypothetical protein